MSHGKLRSQQDTVNAYFDTQRQNALLTLTMVAGLASTIFVPASSLLITYLGWRHALVVLAIAEGVSYLRQGGYSLAVAAIATGALGVLQVDRRVVLTVSARRVPIAMATALMRPGGRVMGLLLIRNAAGVVLFVLLFGLGFGVLHIGRPDLLAQYAPRPLFARLSGMQALLVIFGEATAPTAAAALHTVVRSYTPIFITVGACSLTAAMLFAAADRARRKARVRPV